MVTNADLRLQLLSANFLSLPYILHTLSTLTPLFSLSSILIIFSASYDPSTCQ